MKGTLAVVMMVIIIRAWMKCRGDVPGPRSQIKTSLESQVKDVSLIPKAMRATEKSETEEGLDVICIQEGHSDPR